MKLVPIIILALFVCRTGFCQFDGAEEKIVKGPSDAHRFSLSAGMPYPNVELPPHVKAKLGELTLFADYEHPNAKGVTLYLVNRTGKLRKLASQDRDLRVRLEYLAEDGAWIRAQVHRDSWCGNSYFAIDLPPGQHFRFPGYGPTNGKPAKVRYRSTQQNLVSNIGDGFYLNADRVASELDDMAASQISGILGMVVRAGDFSPYKIKKSTSGYISSLKILSQFSESAYYRKEAEKVIASLDPKAPERAQIREILARKWPSPAKTSGELIELCLKNIETKEHPEIAWKIVREEVSKNSHQGTPLSPGILERLAKALPRSLESANKPEAQMASEMIGIPSFVNELITTDTLLDWNQSENLNVSGASASALARRGKFNDLAKIGLATENADKKYQILSALASGGFIEGYQIRPRRPETDEERKFWKDCLQSDPIKAVESLPRTGESHNPYNRVVHGPIKAHLEMVVNEMGEKPTRNDNLYELSRLVRFFGTWKMAENVPVLEALLNHPEYTEGEVTSSRDGKYLHRRYRIREDARNALLNMRIAVDPDIVLEEKIPRGDNPPKTGTR